MNKRKFPVTNIGSVSLLMVSSCSVWLHLQRYHCLPPPAAIGLHRHLPVTQPLIIRASNKAEKKLAETEKILQACYHSTSDADSYYQQVRQQLGITGSDGSLIYSFQTAVNKSQELEVRIQITYPDSSATAGSDREDSDTASAFYKITCWKMNFYK